MVERTDVEKRVINAIWRGLRDLEILDELYSIRELGLTGSDREEDAISPHIRRLRTEISEARELAPDFAAQMFRDGREWGDVITALSRPSLLSAFEITGIAQKAHAAVQAEQAESEPEPVVVPIIDNQQLIDAALSAHPHDPTLLSLCEQIQTDRAAHEQVQERLQEERDERKARGIDI